MRRGFTLVEMMVVVAIIGILSTILLPSMVRSRYRAYLSACEQNLRNLGAALESYATNDPSHRYPPSLAVLSSQGFISTIVPKCPADSSGYTYTSDSSETKSAYTVEHSGVQNQHELVSPVGYPKFVGSWGLLTK